MEKILTFDCYGTLLNTKPLYEYIGKTAELHNLAKAQAMAVFSSYEDRLMYGEAFMPYDKLLLEVLSYCDMELSAKIFVSRYDELLKIHRDFAPYPDVINSLRILKGKGYELAIMSNSTKKIMEWHLAKLENLFDYSLVAEETKCYKPDLKFFKAAEQMFELYKKEHCHVAKGYWWDIVPAAKMGWKKIWVNRQNLLAGRSSEKPYTTIASLEELPKLL